MATHRIPKTDEVVDAQMWLTTKRDETRHFHASTKKHYAHTDHNGTVVLLGQQDIADAQRAEEDAAGGLVAWMMAHH